MTKRDTRHEGWDPSLYEVEGIFDGHDEVAGWTYLAEKNENEVQGRNYRGTIDATDEFEAEVANVERVCAHCGKTFGFVLDCYVRHVPSGDLLFFGSGCVGDAFALSQADLRAKEAGKAAAIRAARDAWTAANPEAAAALDEYEADEDLSDTFLDDLVRARRLYGALTERQTPWATKALAKAREFAAKRAAREAALAEAPALEVLEGRQTVEGRVVSTKWVENDFGGTFKMLVEMADGNRVYGTVPSSLDPERGDLVKFDAKLEASRDDVHFGFFSRPTKAAILERGEA